LADKHVALSVDESARGWLADKGFDPQMGARPMARVIQDHIKRKLADELLFGALVGGGKVTVAMLDEQLSVTTEAAAPEAADAAVV
ncbi:MAG: ATP-dependent Clp protease ATP-binding subunit ClpA, partial [Xanthomonadales bacterium]|nr:ATP-dependent Clp protease ATP-binding subunit ClpA [Xanthomonadales bacterium]